MSARSIGQALLAMLLWAACYPLITIGIEFAPHISFAALRALLAGAALLVVALWLGAKLPRGWRTWGGIAIVGIGATSLGFLGMFHAAEYVAPGLATVIASTQPLLAAMIANIVLGERLSGRGRLGLGLGFLGILVIVAPKLIEGGADAYLVGIAFVVLAAVGVTVSNVIIKGIAGAVDGPMAMACQLLLGAVPLILIALKTEDPFSIDWSPAFILSLIGLALFGTAAVYWIWFNLLVHVPLNQANAFSFLIPILGLSAGVAFFEESLSMIQAAGVAVTIAGVAIVAGSRSAQDGAPPDLRIRAASAGSPPVKTSASEKRIRTSSTD